jgi:hypothetical protein
MIHDSLPLPLQSIFSGSGKAIENPSENQDFGMALIWLKSGYKVYRKGWKSKSVYMALQKGSPKIFMGYPNRKIIDKDKSKVPWQISYDEVLANDWCIYEENKRNLALNKRGKDYSKEYSKKPNYFPIQEC